MGCILPSDRTEYLLFSKGPYPLKLHSPLLSARSAAFAQGFRRSMGAIFSIGSPGTRPYPNMMSWSLVSALICGIIVMMLQGCSSVERCRSEGGGSYCWACGCRCIGECNITNPPQDLDGEEIVSDPECTSRFVSNYYPDGSLENRDERCAALSDNQCSCAGTFRSMGA